MEYFSSLKNRQTSKLILLGSLICLIYFTALLLLSHYKINIAILGVLIELLTIPFLLLLILLLFISIKNIIKNKFSLKSNYSLSTLVLALIIIMLTLATIYTE